MKALGLIFLGFVFGSLIGLSWMSGALFLSAAVVVLKRRELARALAAMTPPTVWVKEFLPDEPHPEQFSVEATIGEPPQPVAVGSSVIVPNIVELVDVFDGRGRPRRAEVLRATQGHVEVAIVPRRADDQTVLKLPYAYVRAVRANMC